MIGSSRRAEEVDGASRRNRRRFLLILLYALILCPWIVTGALKSLQTNANSPLDWVDHDFGPRRLYDRFSSRFGSADVVVMSWPGCRVDEPSLDTFVRALREAPAFHDQGRSLLHHVTSGRESLAAMVGRPLALPYDEAVKRLTGSLIGPDGKTTCVVIGFNAEGLKQRGRLVPLLRAAAFRYCGAEYDTQHLAGPIMDGYSVDRASQATMNRFAPLSSIIVFCVCMLCLDSFIATLGVFGVSVLCQAVVLAVLHYSGGTMTALLIILPPLVQVLAIAGGIHFVNYYRTAVAEAPASDAVARAFEIAWLPSVLSAATTAIGLGSLMVSGLAAVRDFGAYAAIGVVATVATLLTFLPGILSWFPPTFAKTPNDKKHGGKAKVDPSQGQLVASLPSRASAWQRITAWQQRGSVWVSFAAAMLMIGLGFGVARLDASVRIETLFGNESRLLVDYAWIEKHVGALVPVEVVTIFEPGSQASASERIDLLRKIERNLRSHPQVDAVSSCLSFLPLLPARSDEATAEQVLLHGTPLVKLRNYYADSDDGSDRWRTTAHVTALGNSDYGQLLDELKGSVQSVLAESDTSARAGVSIEISGIMPLVHAIQRQLLQDLFVSFLTAFALIAMVMIVVQAGPLAGLLSMVPNLFPAMTLFGILGWMGHPIDIGSIMTASVAMGIAVDDTLHFLTFFQRELDHGKTRREAVLASYQHCGRAMIQTTLVCGAGLAIFILSDFVPIARFAWMMVVLLGAALLGDLVVLPALLLGPLGRIFDPPEKTPAPAGRFASNRAVCHLKPHGFPLSDDVNAVAKCESRSDARLQHGTRVP